MVIREMQLSDVERVRAIAFSTWRDTYSKFIPEDIQDKVLKQAYSNEEMDNRFKSFLNLVAEDGGEIMGYAFFSGNLSDKEAFLESLYVHPKCQGKGIGKILMYTGFAKFKEATTLSLMVYKGNPSISFYEKEGFKIINENKGDFFEHPVTFILMKKNLINPNGNKE